MATLKIKIDMDNAAFSDNGREAEVKRILVKLCSQIDYEDLDSDFEITLRDVNGNRVGSATVS